MAITTTGSVTPGCVPGMTGNLPSGTYSMVKPTLLYTECSPDKYIVSITGSDLAYCYGDGKVYMGDVTNGVGGSTWAQIL